MGAATVLGMDPSDAHRIGSELLERHGLTGWTLDAGDRRRASRCGCWCRDRCTAEWPGWSRGLSSYHVELPEGRYRVRITGAEPSP